MGTEKVWVAGPKTTLKIGDRVTFSTQVPMENFHSKSMKRDFPIIYFMTNKEASIANISATASPHKKSQKQAIIKPIDNMTKAEGGHTISEIQADKQNLNGKYEKKDFKKQESAPTHNLSVNVEESICIACCSCETIAPEVFTIDKTSNMNPKSRVYNSKGAKNLKIMNAAETCPTKAIIVDDLESKKRIFPY